MRFAVLLSGILMAACTTPSLNTPVSHHTPLPNLAAQWQVVQWPNIVQAAMPNVVLDWRALPRGTAHAGCNTLMYQLQIDEQAQQVALGSVASTRMACGDEARVEMNVARGLGNQRFTVRGDGNDVILTNEHGVELRLRRIDETQ